MNLQLLSGALILLVVKESLADDSKCERNQQLYADLCFSPFPVKLSDIKWMGEDLSPGELYIETGNDVWQHHIAKLLLGRDWGISEVDYQGMCLRMKGSMGEDKKSAKGTHFGYHNLTSNWSCKFSQDLPGLEKCRLRSTNTTYRDDAKVYFIEAKENHAIVIKCFSNGEVGWHTLSKHPNLPEEDKIAVSDYVFALGFPAHSQVAMFDQKCAL